MALLDKFFGLAVGGWDGDWVVISSKIMPLRGPTCKISSRVEIPKLDQFFDLAVVVGGWLVGWGGGHQVENNATSWSNLQDCKISSRVEIPKLDRVWQ